jgi:hypothetical protein
VPVGDNDIENPISTEPEAALVPDDAMDLPLAVRELLDADGSAVMILALDGTVRSINESALELLGAESAEKLLPDTASHGLLRSLLDHAPRHLMGGKSDGTWHGDIDHTDASGDHRVYRSTVTIRHDPNLEGGGFIGLTAHDVTIARQEVSRLRHRATHDPLTGLANRRQILTTLTHAVGAQRDHPGQTDACPDPSSPSARSRDEGHTDCRCQREQQRHVHEVRDEPDLEDQQTRYQIVTNAQVPPTNYLPPQSH